jgi:hypothetical protein
MGQTLRVKPVKGRFTDIMTRLFGKKQSYEVAKARFFIFDFQINITI